MGFKILFVSNFQGREVDTERTEIISEPVISFGDKQDLQKDIKNTHKQRIFYHLSTQNYFSILMSFLFCLLLGRILRPTFSEKANFDNFDCAGYCLGFWLPLLPAILRVLPGGLSLIIKYPWFFDFPSWIVVFFTAGVLFWVYTKNFAESLFLFLPSIGILLNAFAEYFSAENLFPMFFFGKVIEKYPVFSEYWFPIGILALLPVVVFLFKFRRITVLFVTLCISLLIFSAGEFFWQKQKLLNVYPEMKLISFIPLRFKDGNFAYVGEEKQRFFFGEVARFEKPNRQIYENLNDNKELIRLFSLDKKFDFLFHNLFVRPRFRFEIDFNKTNIFIEETSKHRYFFSLRRLEISPNKYSISELTQCDEFFLGLLDFPCYLNSL